jgi:diguanylate cyclase (GGDEF)-like protein
VALLCVAVAIVLAYLLSGSLERDGLLGALEGHALAFAYLGGVALLGLLAGRTPLRGSPRLQTFVDSGWIALLMPGAAGLATLDARVSDLTGYAMVCLPAAFFHSCGRGTMAALQLLGFAGALGGVLWRGELDPQAATIFLTTLGACGATFAYIGMQFESNRHLAFVSARELEQRTAALAAANGQLEANNSELALRTAELARVNAELEAHGEALEAANKRLEELAGTDPLTGVANRRQLYEAIDREFGRARRFGNELALAVLDLDNFGPVNKMHGVIAGDEVLAEFAGTLRAKVRSVDVVARYGGEEFVVVMPDCGAEAAGQLMERVRQHIAQSPLSSRRIAITFSAGVAALAADDLDPVDVLNRADTALRQAKAEGKNQVTVG